MPASRRGGPLQSMVARYALSTRASYTSTPSARSQHFRADLDVFSASTVRSGSARKRCVFNQMRSISLDIRSDSGSLSKARGFYIAPRSPVTAQMGGSFLSNIDTFCDWRPLMFACLNFLPYAIAIAISPVRGGAYFLRSGDAYGAVSEESTISTQSAR